VDEVMLSGAKIRDGIKIGAIDPVRRWMRCAPTLYCYTHVSNQKEKREIGGKGTDDVAVVPVFAELEGGAEVAHPVHDIDDTLVPSIHEIVPVCPINTFVPSREVCSVMNTLPW
jgi:hypothetical protein